jgi:CRP/FNR family transcriptional regulator
MLSQASRQNVLPHPALTRVGHEFPKPVKPVRPVRQLLNPGDEIMLDDHAAQLRRVVEGCVVLYQLLPDGRRQITDIIGPGGLFGCQQEDRYNIGARSLTYTKIDLIDASSAPGLASGAALEALQRLRHHAMLLGRMTAAERTASALLELAQAFARRSTSQSGRKVTFTLYLTRGDLADWLGLTIETVSRTLNQFKRNGLIEYRHTGIVTITRPEALAAIAAGECK